MPPMVAFTFDKREVVVADGARPIGGTFACDVFKASLEGYPVALKLFKKTLDNGFDLSALAQSERRERVKNELQQREKLGDHEHIVMYLGGSSNGTGTSFGEKYIPGLYLVQELMHGSLKQFVHSSSFPIGYKYRNLLIIWVGIVESVEHIHDKKMVHYDISAEHVLLDEFGNPKISQLERAKYKNGELYTEEANKKGSGFSNIPPELLKGHCGLLVDPPRAQQIDSYGLGVLFWECLTRGVPLPFPNPNQFVRDNSSEEDFDNKTVEKFSMDENYPKEIRDLIHLCLSENRSKRPTCREILIQLRGMLNSNSSPWVDEEIHYNPPAEAMQ